ncbi:MAG: hypothetical protein ACYDB9_12860 [Gammaproteobacteria bacterium]
MNFDVYGPYNLPRPKDSKRIVSNDRRDRKKFWEVTVDNKVPGLSEACGCYIFLVGVKAWYVGKTEKSFKRECFQPHKLHLYAIALQNKRAKPRIIFIPALTNKGKFKKPRKNGNTSIRMLEVALIGAAVQNNKKLLNTSTAAKWKNMSVPGFINTRQGQARANAVAELKRALGI